MRWSRQYAFKMLIFQSILTGGDMFGYSLSITCGDGSFDVTREGVINGKCRISCVCGSLSVTVSGHNNGRNCIDKTYPRCLLDS